MGRRATRMLSRHYSRGRSFGRRCRSATILVASLGKQRPCQTAAIRWQVCVAASTDVTSRRLVTRVDAPPRCSWRCARWTGLSGVHRGQQGRPRREQPSRWPGCLDRGRFLAGSDNFLSTLYRLAVTDPSVSPRLHPARIALPRTASGSQSRRESGFRCFSRQHGGSREPETLVARPLRWSITHHPKQRPREARARGLRESLGKLGPGGTGPGTYFGEARVQPENKGRIWHWLPRLVVPTSLVLLAAPSLSRSPSRADENKPKDATTSSYDQIAPSCWGRRASRPCWQGEVSEREFHRLPAVQ
jgi:hypothetical protein